MSPESFTARVYEIVRTIPAGKVATYQDIAERAGDATAARAVGAAMRNNPDPATIPCHRVVGSDGRMHGYAFGGIAAKIQLLYGEGVALRDDRVLLSISRWSPGAGQSPD